jgi:hypothetical protein
MGAMVSPRRGADGNVELLIHALAPPAPATGAVTLDDLASLAAATEP